MTQTKIANHFLCPNPSSSKWIPHLVPLTLYFDPLGSAGKPNTYWISHKSLTTFPRPRWENYHAHNHNSDSIVWNSVVVQQVGVRCLTLFKPINLISSSIIQSIICHLCCDQLLRGMSCVPGAPTVNLSFLYGDLVVALSPVSLQSCDTLFLLYWIKWTGQCCHNPVRIVNKTLLVYLLVNVSM